MLVFEQKNICVLGGTGFVGQHLVSRLVRDGHHVRILTRHRERHRSLLVLPTVEVIKANIHNENDLNKYFAGQDVIINLVGILNESGNKGKGFQKAHVQLAQKVVQACEHNKVTRLLHMSALNASADPKNVVSHYLHTKGQAEELVHVIKGLDVTSFRPSVIFGPGDSFFNRFYQLLKLTPFVMPLACPNARFAPVYVGDVVSAIVHCLYDARTCDQRYDLCGPKSYTLLQLVKFTASFLPYKRRIIGLPPVLSKLQALIMDFVPGKPFSRDNYRSLQVDSVCKGKFPEIFQLTPSSIEEIVPQYLVNRCERGKFQDYRNHARRK
ncbi:MAG: complex I NDUFA9 subunit family protein [Gammaproteobacteria bacterium]|nr:complex I NDUFA9 subunit family protein [Gammaproteobacteria bacterium]